MASLSLYRKYRPQKFKDVIGQNHVKTTLINSLVNNRISHAYLFTGPRGIGKTTIARILAKAVNCHNPKGGEPCNKCSACVEISEGKSLDLIEIDGASNRGIDEIRELREKIKFTPHNNKYKVFIIDEVHMLTKEAFNALLKTLEEPPSHAIFILATTEVHKIPPTVLSRCQRFNFSKISLPQIVETLEKITKEEKIKTSKETLRTIASYSEGALRDAISILDQVASFGNKTITEEFVESILGVANAKAINELVQAIILDERIKSLEIVNKMTEEGIDITLLIDALIERIRDLIFIKVGNLDDFIQYDEEELEKIKTTGEKVKIIDLVLKIEKLNDAKQKVKYSIPNHLPLELTILEFSRDKAGSDENEKTINTKKSDLEDSTPSSPQKNKPTEETQPKKNNNPGRITLKEKNSVKDLISNIKKNWQKILNELKSYNHSLTVCLKTATPERIENNHLLLGFDYSFHKDKIQDIKNKRVVEDAIKKITGKFIPIRCFVSPKKKKGEKSVLDDAINILGGEIIE